MKVRELVELLRSMPQDADVLLDCPYDDGHAWGRAPASKVCRTGRFVDIRADEVGSYELFEERLAAERADSTC